MMNKHKCISEKIWYVIYSGSGSDHDAKVWNQSVAKSYLEGQPWFLAGDTNYLLSSMLIKLFANRVDYEHRLFNVQLSGACTVMTENVYSIWKRHFPVLTNLRFHHDKAMKTVVVMAILHNFSISLGDHDITDLEELLSYENVKAWV